jgi:hypothetical protein
MIHSAVLSQEQPLHSFFLADENPSETQIEYNELAHELMCHAALRIERAVQLAVLQNLGGSLGYHHILQKATDYRNIAILDSVDPETTTLFQDVCKGVLFLLQNRLRGWQAPKVFDSITLTIIKGFGSSPITSRAYATAIIEGFVFDEMLEEGILFSD